MSTEPQARDLGLIFDFDTDKLGDLGQVASAP